MRDGAGKLVRTERVTGTPTQIEALDPGTGKPLVLIGTRKGQVKAFRLAD